MRILILMLAAMVFWNCNSQPPTTDANEPNGAVSLNDTTFNAALAERLGADEYGMRPYVMALLKKGPNRTKDKIEAQRLQRAHMDNISRLAEAGKLVLAGPFLDDGDLRGIYIFDVKTVEEAQALTETDPAIQSGQLVMELHPWYGSAAVMDINRVHQQVAKTKI